MRLRTVDVPCLAVLVQPSPGFAKKRLANFKLDLLGLCEFGCRYCSSNSGNYLRVNRRNFGDLTEAQLGELLLPRESPGLTFHFPGVVEKLEAELRRHRPSWGAGKTLVFSMLTDGFSPSLVRDGITEKALRLILEHTSFRIRILTKSRTPGTARWIRLFREHPDRFVVGFSVGTLDDRWARKVEIGTSSPTARLNALANLQAAGVPNFGMLCPVFPDVLEGRRLEELVERVGPDQVEHLWAEPYNDRGNWRIVRSGYARGRAGWNWLTEVYEHGNLARWSDYATELYARLRDHARKYGWLSKLRFLLYEGGVQEEHVDRLVGLEGVLLQGKPGADGRSQNRHVAEQLCGNRTQNPLKEARDEDRV